MIQYPLDARPRRPQNRAEGKVWDYLIEHGWNVSKRGWPDFFCWKDNGDILLVEVKQKNHHNLKLGQKRVFHALESRGIPIIKFCAENLPDA